MRQHCDILSISSNIRESAPLAKLLSGRYGPLALSRAAGQAAALERIGDSEQVALWRRVVIDLRQNATMIQDVA